VAPKGLDTRPTSDRVREATFNALESRGALVDARILDLFAGSGALGIEALSRGAAHATFVDHDRGALDAIRANLDATGLAGFATVVAWDAAEYLERGNGEAVDVVFLDPPYAFDQWAELLDHVPGDLAVIESDRPIEPGEMWEMAREKRYGTTVVAIFRRRSPY